jgi:hypothetical protein
MIAIRKLAAGLLGSLVLVWAQGALSSEPKSVDDVHMALRILASVYADMESKLPNQLDRLPHENQEFHDGSAAMRDAMANEPADYKAKVLAALDQAVNSSQTVSDTSASRDTAKVKAALEQLAASMRSLNALFPEAIRVEPGSVPAPVHRGAPPSP